MEERTSDVDDVEGDGESECFCGEDGEEQAGEDD